MEAGRHFHDLPLVLLPLVLLLALVPLASLALAPLAPLALTLLAPLAPLALPLLTEHYHVEEDASPKHGLLPPGVVSLLYSFYI